MGNLLCELRHALHSPSRSSRRLPGNLLYGGGIYDAWAFAAAAGLLLAAGPPACWLPARRAAAIWPMQALRQS
ncbi:MAG TPA: hypothetical protein VKZ85_09860 [Woeseiaceae bacterium]|nr:hypothetical protein [Woeseiaceae bacterium]